MAHGQARRQEAQGLVHGPGEEGVQEAGRAQGFEGLVAGEELVRAVAAQGHGDVAAGFAAQQIGGQDGAVAQGLVQAGGQAGQDVQGLGEAERLLVVRRAV